MVASPAYRESLVQRPDEILAGLDLSDRERRRLLAIAVQPGMRVNTAIHRANRLTPIDQTLPFTCVLLGDRLADLVDRYWTEHLTENLQVPAECERFAMFLQAEMDAGNLLDPYLAEVLAFERVCTELRFYTGNELKRRAGAPAGLPPLVRIVRFLHDPVPLLEALGNLRRPPDGLEEGAFHLVVDCRTGEPEFRLLDDGGVETLRSRGLL